MVRLATVYDGLWLEWCSLIHREGRLVRCFVFACCTGAWRALVHVPWSLPVQLTDDDSRPVTRLAHSCKRCRALESQPTVVVRACMFQDGTGLGACLLCSSSKHPLHCWGCAIATNSSYQSASVTTSPAGVYNEFTRRCIGYEATEWVVLSGLCFSGNDPGVSTHCLQI